MHKSAQKYIKIHHFCPAICPAKVPYNKDFFIMQINCNQIPQSGDGFHANRPLIVVNTKRNSRHTPGSHSKTALPTVPKISISNLLDLVNKYFPRTGNGSKPLKKSSFGKGKR